MEEVLAGFVCGYALALLVTPLVALALVRARVHSDLMRRVVPAGTSLIAVSVIIHTFALMTLTAIGMVLGLMLAGLEDSRPDGGLGSPNLIFTSLMIAIAAIAAGPLAIAVPRWRLGLLAGGLIFVATFGWIMPYLSLAAHAKS